MEIEFREEKTLKEIITLCQKDNHVQQVAFSTYHHALTQVCFTCKKVRTSIKQGDL